MLYSYLATSTYLGSCCKSRSIYDLATSNISRRLLPNIFEQLVPLIHPFGDVPHIIVHLARRSAED